MAIVLPLMGTALEMFEALDLFLILDPACFILLEDFAAPIFAVFSDIGRPLLVFGPGSVEVLDLESLEVNLPVESMTGSFVDPLENALTSGQ